MELLQANLLGAVWTAGFWFSAKENESARRLTLKIFRDIKTQNNEE